MKAQQNAANPGSIKDAEQNQKAQRKQELDDLRSVLATTAGRRFLYRFLAGCGVFRTSYTGTVETYYKEGGRNIGLNLMHDLEEADLEAYATLIRENRKVKE